MLYNENFVVTTKSFFEIPQIEYKMCNEQNNVKYVWNQQRNSFVPYQLPDLFSAFESISG